MKQLNKAETIERVREVITDTRPNLMQPGHLERVATLMRQSPGHVGTLNGYSPLLAAEVTSGKLDYDQVTDAFQTLADDA